MKKPEIIVLSKDSDSEFKFLSNGWFYVKIMHTKKAQALMKKAEKCIDKGSDVKETIKLLEKAGFKIVRGKESKRVPEGYELRE